MNKINIYLIFLFFLTEVVSGQIKFEREYRLEYDKVPKSALLFIQDITTSSKVKWIMEESNTGKSIEAKFCFKKKKYSIEFTPSGELIDAEIQVKFSKLASEIQTNITEQFNKQFVKFRIKKVQLQYSGTESSVLQCLKNQCSLVPKYEIVLKGKQNKRFELFEALLIDNGNSIEKLLKFSPRNFDNLEF